MAKRIFFASVQTVWGTVFMRRGVVLLDEIFLYVIPSNLCHGNKRVIMHDDRRGRFIFTCPSFIWGAHIPLSLAPYRAHTFRAAQLSLVSVYFFSATVLP